MGMLQTEPDDRAEGPFAFPGSVESVAVWLDRLLRHSLSDLAAAWHTEDVSPRLSSTPFNEILAAIERAQTDCDPPELGDVDVGQPNRDHRVAEHTDQGHPDRIVLSGSGRAEQVRVGAVALYQRWIEANDGASPVLYAAWFNIGVLFAQGGDNGNAAIAYGNALTMRPDLHSAAINLGLVLEAAGDPERALATWKRAVQPDPVRVALEIQQGRLLEKLGRFEEAEQVLYRVLLTDPAQPDVIHHWMHLRQKTCQWPVASSNLPGISPADLVRSAGPLSILALTDDIDPQREAAAAWIARKTDPAPRRLAPAVPYPHERIRIGYLSSDFCSHAMCYLITELFERHDRRRFEVYGYCSSKDDGSQLRQRVLAAFDHYRPVRTVSDARAAQIIRDDEIDVLIELNGITDGSRLQVLRWKPAPIQATYLGFIGPVPLPELDYLLCDNMVIPPEHAASYQPTPLPTARIYQANDSKRTIGAPTSRAEAGLPVECFVFCCFSRHYKITEELFAAWMSILRRTDRSVLWLASDNACSRVNLLAAAKRAGIDAERLIFSDRVGPDLYLSRLGLADLFLDTFPYNAGTVASDAIRMGLPLVTLCGRAFASRMAASLLHAVGAPRGIATSMAKYVETAVELANNPVAYAEYRALFTARAWRRTIGDIAGFTAEFENTWCRVVDAMRGGLAGSAPPPEMFSEMARADLSSRVNERSEALPHSN